MIVYQDTVRNFIDQCNEEELRSISEIVSEDMRSKGLGYFDNSQVRAWQNSLPAIANVLASCDLDDGVGIAIEYKIRQSRDRIDLIVYGTDENNKDSVVVVELKQWSAVTRTNKIDHVHTFGGHGEDDYWHPSYQAYNYVNLMSNFNEYIQKEDVRMTACAYLHNLDNGNSVLLEDLTLFPVVKEVPVFMKQDEKKLASFISKYVKYGKKDVLYQIENSRIVPSKHLSELLSEALKGNGFFSYDHAQANAVAEIVKTVEDALYYNEKKAIIIKGGAGTGKSIVALNVLGLLLSEQYGKRRNAIYLTANAAPRYLYTEELVGNNYRKKVIKELFKYPSIFKEAGENDYDCVLIDEAHRIFDYKNGVGIPGGTHIFEKIMNGSRVCVFFIDEDQAVTKDDFVTINRIREMAYKCHARVIEGNDLELTTQFRVLGGQDYIDFVKDFLGYTKYGLHYTLNNNYDFRVFDSAKDMMDAIKEKDRQFRTSEKSGKCRVVAGYTYEWVTKNKFRNEDGYDIVLDNGEFKAKWNLRCKEVGSTYSWLNDPESVEEVGCIHTCQGLDLNYCGVIIGKDLTYNELALVFHKEKNAKSDKASGIRTSEDELAKQLIRNTYNVLLTRGMMGTYVYCEDQKLREYLKTLIIEGDSTTSF